jgi:hypothetical protein
LNLRLEKLTTQCTSLKDFGFTIEPKDILQTFLPLSSEVPAAKLLSSHQRAEFQVILGINQIGVLCLSETSSSVSLQGFSDNYLKGHQVGVALDDRDGTQTTPFLKFTGRLNRLYGIDGISTSI